MRAHRPLLPGQLLRLPLRLLLLPRRLLVLGRRLLPRRLLLPRWWLLLL